MTSTPTDTPNTTPYAGLTPEAVLDALDSVGLRGDGRLIQLNSYENRVFQVFLEDATVVVAKFYRPGRWSLPQILEEHAFAAELVAQEIPVVAPLLLGPAKASLHTFAVGGQSYPFSVSPRKSGRPPELEDLDTLEWLGRFIGRMHLLGQQRAFVHRLTLDIPTYGHAPRAAVLESPWMPLDALSTWKQAVDAVLDQVQRCFDAVGPYRSLRLHGDCHSGNVLWTEGAGPHFVDLDDALTGPAVQDLWMLLPGEPQARHAPLQALLRGYENFMLFDRRELVLIEALRSLRMVHYSAWIAKRWDDPAFPAAFPWFGDRAYWNDQATRLMEQLQAMQQGGMV
jgi:Ser/Thr protein kinase RdoA (MazF antagonist)